MRRKNLGESNRLGAGTHDADLSRGEGASEGEVSGLCGHHDFVPVPFGPRPSSERRPPTPDASRPHRGDNPTGIVRGGGTWKHIANFPGGASNTLTGGGTDLEFFNVGKQVYGAFGTLGQDDVGSVGQRFIQLTQKGQVAPRWVADHGSGHCTTSNPRDTGLQHDTQIARKGQITLLTDTTDATGRCHDPNGGGIEIVDVSKIGIRRFQPREVHLVRFAGFSHTHTVDGRFPWIITTAARTSRAGTGSTSWT